MDLQSLYFKIKEIIDTVDFSQLWTGFVPLKFALYDNDKCFFDGRYIKKTEDFLANTSILYNGEYIAIWNVNEDDDLDILASKMIHEMFHAFQNMNHESRFPSEIEALEKYKYSPENLSVKLDENRLIRKLVEHFDTENFEKLMRLRKYRLSHFPFEYRYEAAIEQIEGTANYVELGALRQISAEKYQNSIEKMLDQITEPSCMRPVRIVSYTIGALLFMILKENTNLYFEYFSSETIGESIIKGVSDYDGELLVYEDVKTMICAYDMRTEEIVNDTLKNGSCVAEGEYDLLGVNVYNARYWSGYIISTYFVMYEFNGVKKVLEGDFVIQLNERSKIVRIYQIN